MFFPSLYSLPTSVAKLSLQCCDKVVSSNDKSNLSRSKNIPFRAIEVHKFIIQLEYLPILWIESEHEIFGLAFSVAINIWWLELPLSFNYAISLEGNDSGCFTQNVEKTFSSNKTYRMMGSGSVGRVVTSHKRSTVKIQPSITFTLVSSKLFLLKSGKWRHFINLLLLRKGEIN